MNTLLLINYKIAHINLNGSIGSMTGSLWSLMKLYSETGLNFIVN